MGKLIGYLTVAERENVHRNFEYAGSGEIWNLHPACVEVVSGGYGSPFALYSHPGERIDSWFQNRIGSCYGSDNRDNSVVPGKYPMQLTYFDLARKVLQGEMTLCDGWRVDVYDSAYEDGTPVAQVVQCE